MFIKFEDNAYPGDVCPAEGTLRAFAQRLKRTAFADASVATIHDDAVLRLVHADRAGVVFRCQVLGLLLVGLLVGAVVVPSCPEQVEDSLGFGDGLLDPGLVD